MALQAANVQMVNQAINGKKMEREVFKQVNLQHSLKALTRLLLQVHMSVRDLEGPDLGHTKRLVDIGNLF